MDEENGMDIHSADSRRDEQVTSFSSIVNNMLPTKGDQPINSSPSKVEVSVHTKRDQPINSYAIRANNFLRTGRDQPRNSYDSRVNNLLRTGRDQPINSFTSRVNNSVTTSNLVDKRKKPSIDFESAPTTKNEDDILPRVSPMGNTVMHIAALWGDDEWVEEEAQNKSHLFAKKNYNGDTPLHVAARARHKSTLEKLFAALVRNLLPPYLENPKEALDEILVKNKQGNTFFQEAVMNGQTDVMKILDYQELHIDPGFKELVERAALFWTNNEEKSILHIAIEEGYEDIVVDALNRLSQHHALDELIQNHQELAHMIAEAKSPFPRQDQETQLTGREMKKQKKDSEEPLSLFHNSQFVLYNYMEYVDMKIMKDCSENMSPGNREHTKLTQDSLTNKLTEKYQELAQLIPRGHDYVPPGKSPLIVAIVKQRHGILKRILLKKKEWIHLRDNEGRTVIHYAASIGYLNVVELLLKMQTDGNMERDNDGFFPLHLASAGGHVEVVKKLLNHCQDIEEELLDNYGRNFVHIAAQMGKYNVIRYMLDRKNYPKVKMMINFKDVNGNTPLHLATLHCHPKVVHALTWDKRVDCSLVNKRNETALDACMQFQQEFPSLRQRLIRIALESVGSQKHAKRGSQHSFKLPPRLQNLENGRNQEGQNKDPYKDRINTLMLVSTLITTVTFAAGFTLPGGTNSSDPEKGMALMLNQVWFKPFIFCITVSMYGAISTTIILIWAQLGDITLTRLALKVTLPLLGIILTTLSVAFLAGVHLVISDLSWLATALMVLCVISIIMLSLLYILLWFFSSSGSRVFRHILYYPLKFLIWLDEQGQTHEARFVDSSWHAKKEGEGKKETIDESNT